MIRLTLLLSAIHVGQTSRLCPFIKYLELFCIVQHLKINTFTISSLLSSYSQIQKHFYRHLHHQFVYLDLLELLGLCPMLCQQSFTGTTGLVSFLPLRAHRICSGGDRRGGLTEVSCASELQQDIVGYPWTSICVFQRSKALHCPLINPHLSKVWIHCLN